MDRDGENIIAAPEDILLSIAVMIVNIKDSHPPVVAQILSGDGGI